MSINPKDISETAKNAAETAKNLADVVEMILKPRGIDGVILEGHKKIIEEVVESEKYSIAEKEFFLVNYKRQIKEFRNCKTITEMASFDILPERRIEDVDEDWFAFFFEKAKLISDESMQRIWGKLLAFRVNGNSNINKKLLYTFSLMEDKDVELFCTLCTMTFEDLSKPGGMYPFIYIREYPAYYNNFGIRRYNLAELDNLGLIEYDTHSKFVLPANVPLLGYGDCKIKLESDVRINNGNIRFTNLGQTLYRITNVNLQDGFLEHCKSVWDALGIRYVIEE